MDREQLPLVDVVAHPDVRCSRRMVRAEARVGCRGPAVHGGSPGFRAGIQHPFANCCAGGSGHWRRPHGPTSPAIVAKAYPKTGRGKAIGIWAAASSSRWSSVRRRAAQSSLQSAQRDCGRCLGSTCHLAVPRFSSSGCEYHPIPRRYPAHPFDGRPPGDRSPVSDRFRV